MKLKSTVYAGYALVAVLLVAACGGGGSGSDTQEQPVAQPANNAPSISGIPGEEVSAGRTYSFTPEASDPDGDTLTFAVSNAPFWAVFDSATGTLEGIPDALSIGQFEDIEISVSDGSASDALPAWSITVSPKKIGRNDISTEGDVLPTDDGFRAVGRLVVDLGEDFRQQFENADLDLSFDQAGNLVDFEGETDLPTSLSRNVSVTAGVKAIVGMMRGSEINADEDFGITLMEDTNYFVYYLGNTFEMDVSDRDNPDSTESVTVEPPASGTIILILDPADSFLYQFASSPSGDGGEGESDNGLIPFYPELNFAELDSFNGHIIKKGAMGVGIKIFDFFEIGGTRVTKEPQFSDIDWDDPFNSPIEYRAGMNGFADFSLSIAGFGLLSFELAETSATLDVGFDRQQMALSLQVEPERPILPEIFGIQPLSTITGSGFVDGDGQYGFELGGVWHSTVPEADINGSLRVETGAVGLEGSVTEGNTTLVASLDLFNNQTVGRVSFPESFSHNITGIVDEALDRKLDDVQEAVSALEEAIADYEFEVSLGGLRDSLPAIADAAVTEANKVPGKARSAAKSSTLSFLQNTCRSVNLGVTTVEYCLDDLVDADDVANAAGDSAYDEAADAIVTPKAAMLEMKKRALEADDETLRNALKASLDGAYNNRSVNVSVTVKRAFGDPFDATYTIYSTDTDYEILDAATASQVKDAADNVHRIGETESVVISSQDVLDRLPTEEAIESVRSEVNEGVAAVPTVDGLGYLAIGDAYSAFATVDGNDRDIPINVLKPSEVRDGVGDLLAGILLDAAD